MGAFGLLSLRGNLPDYAGGNVPVWSRPITNSLTLTHGLYSKSLRYNVYTFTISGADTGAVRDLTINAYRGLLLLTKFGVRVDGAVVNAEVADLDNNGFPELYVYCTSDGSGSFGRVHAWQFLLERKADITLAGWTLPKDSGYMGHDSLWIERDILCRKYPIYQSGDANTGPTGGTRMVRYRLKPTGLKFTLVAQPD
ncbi:hypothetical protein GCM10027423_47220 [Spirosoma arcticum]